MAEKTNQEEVDKSLKLILKSSLIVFIGVILSKILTYAYRIVIARNFGPDIYGLFSLSIIILFWFVTFFSIGLYEGILRFVALYRGDKQLDKIKYVLKFSIILLLILSIFSGVLLYLFAGVISINIFHNPDLIFFLRVLSFTIPFYMVSYGGLSIIQAFEKIKIHSFISDFLKNFINLVTLLILVFLGVNSSAVIFSYSLGILAVFLAFFFYAKYNLPKLFGKSQIRKEQKIKIRNQILSYSWPLLFSVVFYSILGDIDSFIIGYFKGVTAVGFYNAAVPIAILMGFFPSLFVRLFSPLVTKEFSRKKLGVIKELSKQVEKWILIVNLPILLLIILFPEAIINLLFGSEFVVAKNALRFLTIGTFVYFMSDIPHRLLSMLGKSKTILFSIIFAATLNLILNIILVPMPSIFGLNNSLGMVGASLATMISYIVLTLIFFFQVKRNLVLIPLRRKMFRILISLIISGIVLLFIKQVIPYNFISIILQGTFFILFYILLLFITKSFDKNDLMIFHAIKQRFQN